MIKLLLRTGGSQHRTASKCADKKDSGMTGQPCAKVAKYCNTQMFASTLAENCPVTCGKCGGAAKIACQNGGSAVTCDDGVRNGNERLTDCGGGCTRNATCA